MVGPSRSAMDNHLSRYESSSDAGNDSDGSVRGMASVRHSSAASASSSGTHETSFWSTVFADASHPIPTNVFAFLATWWHQQQPFIAQLIHDYGAILADLITPFTPRTARRAGYCCASHDLLRSFDRIDLELPGGEGRWSCRWRSRRRGVGRETVVLPGRISSVYSAVGGASVAAVVVMVAAAVSWCSWRRSSPGWLLLFGEVAIGSAGLTHFFAREDGYHEAKLLETRLGALEDSLGPFFRAVHSCMRMIRCSQTLSFGLGLSVPMPPVARMEGRLSAGGTRSRSGQPQLALRELRSILTGVLEGGVEQANTFEPKDRFIATERDDDSGDACDSFESEGRAVDSGSDGKVQFLADLFEKEKQLVAYLRRFVAGAAARVDEAMARPDVCGLWWESQLTDVSQAVKELANYFYAAGERLEVAIGSSPQPLSVSQEASSSCQVSAAAEVLSSLRLHYEEILVKLYSCQNNAISITRDPTKSTADLWDVVRRELADARLSTGACDREKELWREAENLVNSNANGVDQSGPILSPGASRSENHSDNFRHLEAGVGWVSLATSREEDGPRVYEGGSGDEGAEGVMRTTAEKEVTDVLVGVPSPSRTRSERESGTDSRTTAEELANERSRTQLFGELDSVLRARPVPPVCEKRLPLESQQSLGEHDDSDVAAEQSMEQSVNVLPPPAASAFPETERAGNENLMSELRAQLSMAVNEEIFLSDTHRYRASSEDEEDSVGVLVEHDEQPRNGDVSAFSG